MSDLRPPAAPTRAGTARSVLALFREPFWLRAFLLVGVLSVLFVVLGRWQWSRHETRSQDRSSVASNYGADPVPLSEVLPDAGRALPADFEWLPVVVRGRYEADRTIVVRNRPLDSRPGYEVLVPLRTPGGPVLLVNRGWVPGGESSAGPGAVPAPPSGEVTVVARLRAPEPPLDRSPPPGQALRIDVPRIERDLGTPTYQAYAVLDTEDPAPPARPEPLPVPSPEVGINLAYSVQWWGFAVAAYGLLGYYALKEVRRRALPAEPPEVGPDAVAPGPGARDRVAVGAGPPPGTGPASVAVRSPRWRRRSERRELSDEEWEDAADR